MSKIVITVEEYEPKNFKVTVENDVTITTETTDSPMKYVVNALRENAFRGKKGRKPLKKVVPA